MKKLLSAAAVAMALSSSAYASLNVGGVIWNPDSLDDFTSSDTMYESLATFTGATLVSGNIYNFTGANTLSGFARITAFNGEIQSSFCPSCELTYQFGGYQLNQWKDIDFSGTVNAGDALSFSGGFAKFYVDGSPDFSSASYASAGDGTLWLDLVGFSTLNSNGLTGTLFSTITSGSLGTGTEAGNGFGYLNVVTGTGALAEANFDTNGQPNGTDISLGSSFLPRPCSSLGTCSNFPLTGSNALLGNSIPEPGSLALLGLGLAGLGAVARKRKA